MATVKQNNEFKKFLSDNNVNREDLTRDDAKEFLSSWTVKRFTAPSNEPEITWRELGKEIFEWVDLNSSNESEITWRKLGKEIFEWVDLNSTDTTPTDTTPTEEQKKDFPKGTFDWPSPVVIWPDWKLSTWFTPLEVEPSVQETYAINNNLPFERWSKNQIMFQPKNLDEAIDLYSTFWPNVSIDKTSSAAIRWSKVYQEYSKYKGADKATLTQAFKNNTLWVWWETWDRLVKMNWWEATFEMLEAKKDYELSLKTNNINDLSNIVQWNEIEPTQTAITTKIDSLDKAYIDKINSLFEWMWDNWNAYKEWSEVTRELNTSITDRSWEIDELNVAKRDILKDIQEQHPNLPYGNQLAIASEQMADIDDQLFVLQREQNIDISKLNYETTQLKWDYEFKVQQDNAKLGLINSMYGTARQDLKEQAWFERADLKEQAWFERADTIREQGFERADTIREQGFERADRITAESIARQDKQIEDQMKAAVEAKKQAVIDWDVTLAKKYAYDIAILQEKEKLNKSAKDSIITLGWDAYLEYNTETGWWDQKTTTKEEGTDTTTSTTPSWKLTQLSYTTAWWTNKILQVDESAKSSLQNIMDIFKVDQTTSTPWDKVIIAQSFRTKEEQQRLYDAYKAWTGWLAAKPWTSKHESWMAIDIYKNDKLEALNDKQVAIMNENGWYQTAWASDMGHFEYIGEPGETTTSQFTPIEESILSSFNWKDIEKLAEDLWTTEAWARTKFNDYMKSQELQSWPLNDLGTFLKDNQPRWVWYSNDDVEAFDKKIDKAIKEWNRDKIVEAYRTNLLQWNKWLSTALVEWLSVTRRIDKLSQDIEAYKKSGKDTSLFSWTVEEVANKLWESNDTALNNIGNQLQFITADYIRAISWTAAADAEVARLISSLPSTKASFDLNTIRLWNFQWKIKDGLETHLDVLLGKRKDLWQEMFPEVYEWLPWQDTSTTNKQSTSKTWWTKQKTPVTTNNPFSTNNPFISNP